MPNSPRFSIITPVYNTRKTHFWQLFRSISRQTFRDWEWILVDDGSNNPGLTRLLNFASKLDQRVRVFNSPVNQGIVPASNKAIASASGDFLVFVDHDDLLEKSALTIVSTAINRHPEGIYFYSDEDKIGFWGRKFDTFRKPDWSPERLRGQMYLGHLSVISREITNRVGGLRSECEGSQDHDLALRVTEQKGEIIHIPEILYHWRAGKGSTALTPDAKPYTWDAGLLAVSEHIQRVGLDAVAELGPVPGTYSINRQIKVDELVSVVIPTRGAGGLVRGEEKVYILECLRSIFRTSRGAALELIVVIDDDTPSEVVAALNSEFGDRIKLSYFSGVFNFSKKCNVGFLASTAENVVFLNDDMEIITDNFIHKLVAPLKEANIGVVGAKLLYEDGTIQHAGLSFQGRDVWNSYSGAPSDAYGYFSSLLINHEVSGVTGAAMAIAREAYFEIGGFSESLPGNFNDVDLCKKVHAKGLTVLWLSAVESYHFESKSRVAKVLDFEHEFLLRRWGRELSDPFRSENHLRDPAS